MSSERHIQDIIRLEAARRGWHLWRNNRGVARETDFDGRVIRVVRYGLANDSPALGDALKSADLIGWDANGRFLSIEVKRPGGPVMPGQEAWRNLVELGGGYARIVSRIEDLD